MYLFLHILCGINTFVECNMFPSASTIPFLHLYSNKLLPAHSHSMYQVCYFTIQNVENIVSIFIFLLPISLNPQIRYPHSHILLFTITIYMQPQIFNVWIIKNYREKYLSEWNARKYFAKHFNEHFNWL